MQSSVLQEIPPEFSALPANLLTNRMHLKGSLRKFELPGRHKA